jgi:hypothetical protein
MPNFEIYNTLSRPLSGYSHDIPGLDCFSLIYTTPAQIGRNAVKHSSMVNDHGLTMALYES